MEFGSKYVYAYSDSEEESISEEEYETGIDSKSSVPAGRYSAYYTPKPNAERTANAAASDSKKPRNFFSFMKKSGSTKDEKSKSVPGAPQGGATTKSSTKSRAQPATGERAVRFGIGKKWRRADTNVIAVKFNEALVAPQCMHTGDPVICTGCQGMMSHISKIIEYDGNGEDGLKKWACEFCGVMNEVDLTSDEIPSQSDVTYMIEPAPCTTGAGRSGADESLVVFCIDTSGSMCVSQEVPAMMNFNRSQSERYHTLNTENASQWLPGQRRNVSYITRLQALQAAVEQQLEELSNEHPTRRAALVTFNNEVTVIGDGRSTAVTVAGEKLNEWETLVSIGAQLSLPVAVKDSRQSLRKKIYDLEEEGQTALGPAMLLSVAMASQVPGSKVIMCTDGMANIGVGNLDIAEGQGEREQGSAIEEGDDEYSRSSTFYSKVAELSSASGVSVSVITIAGTECRLVELGGVANETGGQVNIVDPLKFQKQFGDILADTIIASRVVATFLVHKRLYIRGEPERVNRLVKEVGNVTKKSEITFEYGVLSKQEFQKGQQQQQQASQASGSQPDMKVTTAAAAAATASAKAPADDLSAANANGSSTDLLPVADSDATATDIALLTEGFQSTTTAEAIGSSESGASAVALSTAASMCSDNKAAGSATSAAGSATEAAGSATTAAGSATTAAGSATTEAVSTPQLLLDSCYPTAVTSAVDTSDTTPAAAAKATAAALSTISASVAAASSKDAASVAATATPAAVSATFTIGADPAATRAAAAAATGAAAGFEDEGPAELPFQVQIRYTDLDGAQAMRVITQTKPVTRDRGQAENYVNFPVIGCHASKASSNLAQQGAYAPSRLNAFTYRRLFSRSSRSDVTDNLDRYVNLMAPLDQHLLQAQRMEASERGGSVSHYDDEDDDFDTFSSNISSARPAGGFSTGALRPPPRQPVAPNRYSQGALARRRMCSDETAVAIYNNSSVSSENFKKSD